MNTFFGAKFIPTKWSEFDFWVQLWEQKTEALQLLLQMNKRAPELLYFNTFYKALACGVGTAGFGAGLGMAYHHLGNRHVHRARKSKKAFDE